MIALIFLIGNFVLIVLGCLLLVKDIVTSLRGKKVKDEDKIVPKYTKRSYLFSILALLTLVILSVIY